MKAVRIFYDKTVLPDGAIVQMTIWQLPRSTSERPHGPKYSLFYGGPNGRIVGYDNESGKGDHKHIRVRIPAIADSDSILMADSVPR